MSEENNQGKVEENNEKLIGNNQENNIAESELNNYEEVDNSNINTTGLDETNQLEKVKVNEAFDENNKKIEVNIKNILSKIKIAYQNKNVKITTCIVLGVILALTVGYNFSDKKAYNNVDKYLKDSVKYDLEFLRKNIDKLLKDDDGHKFEELLEIAVKNNDGRLATELLEIASNNYSEVINYSKLMKTLFDNYDSNLKSSLISTIKKNDKDINEENFISSQSEIINVDNQKFVINYNRYISNEFGNSDNIHKLDVEIKDLMNLYIDGELTEEGLKGFIINKDNEFTLSEIILCTKDAINSNNTSKVKKFLDIKNKFELAGSEETENQIILLTQLVEALDSRSILNNEKETLVKQYNEAESNISQKNRDLEYAKENKSEAEIKINNYNAELAKIKPFTISGYIISKAGTFDNKLGKGEQYEVKYTSSVPFSNQSQVDRFILSTINTQYTTKGNFSLQVVYMGEEDITVKEEFGGFNQTWMHYCEYAGKVKTTTDEAINALQKKIDTQNEIIGRVEIIQSEINEIKSFIENYDTIIKDAEEKVAAEDNKILELRKQLEM